MLLNDDCVCDPGYVEAIVAPLDPAAGVTMAAGVMREAGDPSRIDTAGMQLDRTLLVFDYLNGEPVARLDDGVARPDRALRRRGGVRPRGVPGRRRASTRRCSPTGRTSTWC